jgi:hypothetical protein
LFAALFGKLRFSAGSRFRALLALRTFAFADVIHQQSILLIQIELSFRFFRLLLSLLLIELLARRLLRWRSRKHAVDESLARSTRHIDAGIILQRTRELRTCLCFLRQCHTVVDLPPSRVLSHQRARISVYSPLSSLTAPTDHVVGY